MAQTTSTTNTPAAAGQVVPPVIYNITINGAADTLAIYAFDAELRQAYGSHDLFFVRYEFPHNYPTINSLSLWPDNALVSITWGRSPDTSTWYGYLNHYELNSESDTGFHNQQVTYVCVGTSKVLQSDVTQIWQNTSPTTMASQIASENGFRSIISPGGQPLTYEVQTGESNFAFLNRIGNKYGLKFYVSGGTLYMTDPAAALDSASTASTPTYQMDKNIGWQDTLRNFKWSQGDNLPGGTLTNKTLYAIDSTSGQVIQATANSTETSTTNYIQTGRIVDSQADAQTAVDAWQNQTQFWIGGTAQVFGSPTLYPGKVILFGGQSLPGGAAGNWLVTGARHQMRAAMTGQVTTLDRYATDIQVVRNAAASDVTLSTTQAVSPEFVGMSSSGTQWMASDTSTISTGGSITSFPHFRK